jgi:hypothetical protein
MNNIKIKLFRDIIIKAIICSLLLLNIINAQTTPELQTAVMKLGHIWLGVSANGYRSNFDYLTGFFPSDYDIMANRGQYAEGYTGAGIIITALRWFNPIADSVQPVAQYSYTNNLSPDWGAGKVLVPITNYLRYGFPKQVVDFNEVPLDNFATVNPGYGEFQNHTFDEICEVTDSTVFGVNVYRKLLAWSQNYNDNYIIVDLTLTNASSVTLDSVFINIHESKDNLQYSNGHNPAPGSADAFDIKANNWQHYYGGRPGDSLRVFYEYSADNPQKSGDDMGAPATTQRGRLLDPNMTFFAILHASKEPYSDPSQDIDDPLQPKITYSGAPNYFPRAVENDVYNSSNFYVIRGGFSDDNPMPNSYPETHHEVNSDELGLADNSAVPAARPQNPAYRYVSFGPYNFAPGQKIHIVYASGYAGIGFEKGQEIGQKWINGTLQDPPNIPDPNTGWLPSNFQFPPGATEMDKRKDRWISTGIDSVMLSAYRAQWNYDHNYNIPQAPPPPDSATVTGYGDGVQIEWTDLEAESMPNFAGYRVMSRITSDDTIFYKVVYESDSNDKATHHSIKLTNVIPSAQYYYYIQSKAKIGENDPNADPTTRGKIMYSSRLLYPNIDFVQPPRFAGQPDLSKIRIVPNPYNINDPLLLKFYSDTDGRNITFYNLPSFCNIKIYTENGDLVQTIEHNNRLGLGSETWDMLTSSQQVINSGVYIAVFTKPDGELSYQKFVVVR